MRKPRSVLSPREASRRPRGVTGRLRGAEHRPGGASRRPGGASGSPRRASGDDPRGDEAAPSGQPSAPRGEGLAPRGRPSAPRSAPRSLTTEFQGAPPSPRPRLLAAPCAPEVGGGGTVLRLPGSVEAPGRTLRLRWIPSRSPSGAHLPTPHGTILSMASRRSIPDGNQRASDAQ